MDVMPTDGVLLLEKLAQEARRVADQMTDPFCKRVMHEIAAGYERLVQHAKAQERNLKIASRQDDSNLARVSAPGALPA